MEINSRRRKKVYEKLEPFTQKLKIPSEIDFSKVKEAVFTTQKSKVNIFSDAKTDIGIWTLDKKPYDMLRVDQKVKLGTTEIWEIKSTAHMAHHFHMHGVRFQVLGRDGKLSFAADKGCKDTVIVVPNEMVCIIVRFTVPGFFVYHCQILEHEDHSMMANFLVE